MKKRNIYSISRSPSSWQMKKKRCRLIKVREEKNLEKHKRDGHLPYLPCEIGNQLARPRPKTSLRYLIGRWGVGHPKKCTTWMHGYIFNESAPTTRRKKNTKKSTTTRRRIIIRRSRRWSYICEIEICGMAAVAAVAILRAAIGQTTRTVSLLADW